MPRILPGDQAIDPASPYGTETEMPFSGVRSFLRRRYTRDLAGADYAVMGIPYDLSTSGRPGARLGPEAVRRASSLMSWGEVWPWDFDPFDRLAVVDIGDVFYRRGQPDEMLKAAEAQARFVLDAGCRLVTIGGDHLVTLPLLRAHAAVHGPLALIQFDAHRDTAKSHFLDHGTFVHHAMQEGLIDPARSIQIGIRTWYTHDDPITVLYRPDVRRLGATGVTEEIRRVVGAGPAYLTFDIDCVDPAFAPGTGTPVVDGLTPPEVFDVIRALGSLDIRGMDLVEVSPPFDAGEVTSLFAAAVILEHFCAVAAGRPDRRHAAHGPAEGGD
ncbi:agmatinase [Methylobrevis albus]|uniref:Agmatinase n=1 Tax=Methylobrevis albus TaxID=2793297 RepID=A0A931I4K4_9HYPH|nr:agmatinase [Methylobrevis albus]MBH0238761.1 agmatinase [Methylobrevis albus]